MRARSNDDWSRPVLAALEGELSWLIRWPTRPDPNQDVSASLVLRNREDALLNR